MVGESNSGLVALASILSGGGGTAAQTSYDNTDSGLVATNVQGAIDEVAGGSEPLVIEIDTTLIGEDGVYTGDVPSVSDINQAIQSNKLIILKSNNFYGAAFPRFSCFASHLTTFASINLISGIVFVGMTLGIHLQYEEDGTVKVEILVEEL